MANQMVRQERPVAVYRLVGEGPIGFSVMSMPPVSAPRELAEKLSPWKGKDGLQVTDEAKLEIAVVVGDFARSQDWTQLFEVAVVAGLSPANLIFRFGQRGEFAGGLFSVQPDLDKYDAIGGFLFIADFWHLGHTRDFFNAQEAYVPYKWALQVLAETERQKAAKAVPSGSA